MVNLYIASLSTTSTFNINYISIIEEMFFCMFQESHLFQKVQISISKISFGWQFHFPTHFISRLNIPGLTKESRKCSSSVYWYDCTLELHLRDWKDIPEAIHVSLSKIHVISYLVSKASKCKSFTQIMHKLECCSKPSLIILNS